MVIIGGGFAFTTLRSSIVYMLHPENRARFKDITVVYGARTPGLLLYREELAAWERRDDIRMHITVDGTQDPNWKYNVGFVPAVVKQKITSAEDAYALVCGPPIMIKFTLPVLQEAGVPAGEDHPLPGDAHEVRHRHVRPVQHRGPVCVQGRPRLHPGAAAGAAAGILADLTSSPLGAHNWGIKSRVQFHGP